MRKLKKSLKKRKGLEAKIKRQEFLHALKHGKPTPTNIGSIEAQEILKKIRNRRGASPQPQPNSSPYDASTNGIMEKIKRLAGLRLK